MLITKDLILKDSKCRAQIIPFSIFTAVGFLLLFAPFSVADLSKTNLIISEIFLFLVFTLPFGYFIGIRNLIKAIKTYRAIIKGQYIIVVDQVLDKHYYNDSSSFNSSDIDHSGWLLYFKDYYKKYNDFVKIKNIKEGDYLKSGDEYYLVFVKGSEGPSYAYKCDKYQLAESENDKLETIESVKNYINKREFKLEKNNQLIRINKKRIMNDFFDKQQKFTVLVFILSWIFILVFLIILLISLKNILAFIILLILFVFWSFLTFVKVKYVIDVIRSIKKDTYKIKVDTVIKLNSNIKFSDSNSIISFKFDNYKKIVYADKRDYADVVIGDKFYLVFVNGEKEPIKVYQVKHSIVEKDVLVDA